MQPRAGLANNLIVSAFWRIVVIRPILNPELGDGACEKESGHIATL
jgi:hypothetical protein